MNLPRKIALLKLGNMLVEGPLAIYESDPDSCAYAISTFAAHWHCERSKRSRSIKVYCDANGDDYFGYLPPIFRYSEWNRDDDLSEHWAPPTWPSVLVELRALPQGNEALLESIISIQKKLDQPLVATFGVPTKRDFGEITSKGGHPGEAGHLKIETTCGHQTLARSFWTAEAPEFAEIFEELCTSIRKYELLQPSGRWLERYDNSLTGILEPEHWLWDLRPGDL